MSIIYNTPRHLVVWWHIYKAKRNMLKSSLNTKVHFVAVVELSIIYDTILIRRWTYYVLNKLLKNGNLNNLQKRNWANSICWGRLCDMIESSRRDQSLLWLMVCKRWHFWFQFTKFQINNAQNSKIGKNYTCNKFNFYLGKTPPP